MYTIRINNWQGGLIKRLMDALLVREDVDTMREELVQLEHSVSNTLVEAVYLGYTLRDGGQFVVSECHRQLLLSACRCGLKYGAEWLIAYPAHEGEWDGWDAVLAIYAVLGDLDQAEQDNPGIVHNLSCM